MTLSAHLLLSILIQLVIGGVILWLLWWFISYVNPPEPIKKVAQVLIALVAVVWLINLLLSLAGHPFITFS